MFKNNYKNMAPSNNTKPVSVSVILVIISLFIYVFSVNLLVDSDLWGHLKFGQDIFMKLAVPRYDFYSYSSYGAQWINHEWLGELILYIIFKFTQGAGLIIFKYFMGLVVTFLIYISAIKNTKSLCLRLLFLALSLPVICSGFAIRPQIFTYVLFTALVLLIDNFENTHSRWIYSLPVIFLFWQNVHGGFLAGLGILLLYTLLKISEGKATKKLIFITIASIVATFINPYGLNNWYIVLDAVSRKRAYITEWQQIGFTLEYIQYFALCLVAIVGLLFAKRRRSAYEIFSILISFYFSFRYNRHVVLFAILVALYLPKYIDSFAGNWLVRVENKFSKNLLAVVFTCVSLYLFSATYYKGKNLLALEIPQDTFPIHAFKFIKYNNIKGNIFSSFDWSMMCISELSKTSKIFFDGRYEMVYRDNFIQGYFEVLFGKRDYKEFLRKFPETDIMFLDKNAPLTRAISKDSEWIKVYSSSLAEIYLKNNQHNKNYIENFNNGKIVYPQEDYRIYYLNNL